MKTVSKIRMAWNKFSPFIVFLFVFSLSLLALKAVRRADQRGCRDAAHQAHYEWKKFFDKSATIGSIRKERLEGADVFRVSYVYRIDREFIEKILARDEKPDFNYFEKVYLYVPDPNRIKSEKGFFSQDPDAYVLVFTEKDWQKITAEYRSVVADFRARRGPTHLWHFSPEKPPVFDDFVPINY